MGIGLSYGSLATIEMDVRPAIVGNEVLIGERSPEGAKLRAYSLDGGVRELPFPAPAGADVESVSASPSLLAVTTSTQEGDDYFAKVDAVGYAAFTGPTAGPLRPLPFLADQIAVSGETIVSTEQGGIFMRTAGGPPQQLMAVERFNQVSDPQAVGNFVAYTYWPDHGDSQVVVHEIPSGREVYRTSYFQDYALTADGRVAWVNLLDGGNESDDWPARIMVASPAQPRSRAVARVRLHTPFLAASGNQIVVAERAGSHGRLVTFDFEGRNRRVISGPLWDLGDFVLAGTTLAFTSGRCTYAGPLTARPAPREECTDHVAELDSVKTRGDRVRVTLVCRRGAHCYATLRLVDKRVLKQRSVRIPRGRTVVTLRGRARSLQLVADGLIRSSRVIG